MPVFYLSKRAEADLLNIGAYSIRNWGRSQAALYLNDLEACCQRLADNPGLGRACDEIRPGLRRMEHGKHAVFYRVVPDGIVVSRILHERMLPRKHAIDNTDKTSP